MNALVNAFVWTAATSGFAAVVAVLVGLVVRLGGRRLPPRGQYWLWWLVAWRLLLPVAPATSWSPLNWLPDGDHFSFRVVSSHEPTGPAPVAIPAAGELRGLSPARDPGTPALESGRGGRVAPERSSVAWLGACALVWCPGVMGYLAWVLVQRVRLGRRIRPAGPAPQRLVRLLNEGRSRLGLRQEVRVVVLEKFGSPAICGVLSPQLLISRQTAGELSDAELGHVILHELVHVRRCDVLLNWVWIGLQAWHWFNPAVWWAGRRWRAERELLCDAEVLRRLRGEEHQIYGETLLRLATLLLDRRPAPDLAPVITQSQHLERRLRMILQPPNASRLSLIAAGLLVLAIVGLLFTRAAVRAAPALAEPVSAEAAAAAAAKAKALTSQERQRSIRILEEEKEKLESLAHDRQVKVDRLRSELRIDEGDARDARGAFSASEARYRLEADRISAEAAQARQLSMLQTLTNLSRAELKRALPTALPDPLLSRMLEEQLRVERELATTLGTLGEEHRDTQSLRRLLAVLQKQIDERLDGILIGLRVQLKSEEEHVKALARAVEEGRRNELNSATARVPYDAAKRDLENTRFLIDRLNARIVQERIDARLQNP